MIHAKICNHTFSFIWHLHLQIGVREAGRFLNARQKRRDQGKIVEQIYSSPESSDELQKSKIKSKQKKLKKKVSKPVTSDSSDDEFNLEKFRARRKKFILPDETDDSDQNTPNLPETGEQTGGIHSLKAG